MAKKNAAPICSRCETPYRRATSFCTTCGSPTPWATHEERVQWEVGQWRASRGSADSDPAQMMLVKTQDGYQPVPYQHHYVWDQPLHPEREEPHPASQPLASYVSRPPATAAAVAPHPAPVMDEPPQQVAATEPKEAPHPVSTFEPDRSAEPGTNGSTHPPRTATMYIPAPEVVRRPDAPAAESVPSSPPAADVRPATSKDVRVSRKAIVLGLVLALGLPLGSRAMNALRDDPTGTTVPAMDGDAPSRLQALPIGTMGAGFMQIGPDTARYAVLVQNLNAVFTARSVAVHISLLDAAGGLIGTATERVPSLPPNATLGFAGATGVAGPVARITASVETGSFDRAPQAAGFEVRGVRVTRSATEVVVHANISAEAPGRSRVVAVHLDEAGRVVGGDFSYADLPKAPTETTVVISTADTTQRVVRAAVFVLPPR